MPPRSRRRSWRAISVGRLEVRLVRGLLLAAAPHRAAGVDVDRRQRLGAVDHDRAAGPELDAALVDRLDLRLEPEAGEDRLLALVELKEMLLAGHHVVEEVLGALVDLVVVDEDLVDVGGEVVADGAEDEVVLAVDERRRALALGVLLDARPQALEVVEVALELAALLVEAGGGAHDDPAAGRRIRGCSIISRTRTRSSPSILREIPASSDPGKQDEVASRQRVERRERGRLVGELLLDDLNQHLVARLEDLLDAAAALVAGSRPGRGRAVAARREIPKADLVEREERVALGTDVDERRLDRRMNPPDDTLVDIALQMLAAERLDLEGLELAVLNDPDAALFRMGDVDQHDLRHGGLYPPPPLLDPAKSYHRQFRGARRTAGPVPRRNASRRGAERAVPRPRLTGRRRGRVAVPRARAVRREALPRRNRGGRCPRTFRRRRSTSARRRRRGPPPRRYWP